MTRTHRPGAGLTPIVLALLVASVGALPVHGDGQGDLQTDFTTGNARVVVAVLDTGVNPYHPVFHRAGAQLPLSDFEDVENGNAQATPVNLSDASSGSYQTLVEDDGKLWASIGEGELINFTGTNLMAISFHDPAQGPGEHRVLDYDGHGTATASTVLAHHEDALIVLVQPQVVNTPAGIAFTAESLADAMAWCAAQPWIDVVSLSAGFAANLPLGDGSLAAGTLSAHQAGKVVVVSSGNDPSPAPTDESDAPPWVLSVTGSQADGRSKEVLSSNLYPDYIAPYTVKAAAAKTTGDAYQDWGGTSFSAPAVAGTVAGIIHDLRWKADHDGSITDEGALVPGFTHDEQTVEAVDNGDVRAALNKTAELPQWEGYVAGLNHNGDHAHPPGAPWLTAQWGLVTSAIIEDAVQALLDGDLDMPEEKAAAWAYKAATHHARVTYWKQLAGP